MKKSLHSLFIAAVVSVTAVCAQAAEAVSEAVVLKVKGQVHAQIPGQSGPVVIKVGDKLPQGTAIKTNKNSTTDIQVFSGAVTTIQEETQADLTKLSLTTENGAISKQTALINLTLGTVVSSLDPEKKSINDYSVQTPRGVAAARGTRYTVTVGTDGAVRTFVATGVVVFINAATNQTVTIQPGYAVIIDANGNISDPIEAADLPSGGTQTLVGDDTETVIDITVVSPSS